MKAKSKNVGVLRTSKNAIDAIDAKKTPAGNIRFRELISSSLVNPVLYRVIFFSEKITSYKVR